MSLTLSIVSGTYNRLALLQSMVNSARLALPAGIAYEFVIVDAGSTDGSLEWLRQQPDVQLVEHGERRGAIPAFCEGARAARGDYVLLANDDVRFMPLSITRAIRHLEDFGTCGAVAFMDNRPAPGYGTEFKVQIVSAKRPDGEGCTVAYAQVGLFRRWLGDLAGWWGVDDPVMATARTYGGDNYLSARIWEMGYSVDQVTGVAVVDEVPQDAMRAENSAFEGQMHPDSACYLRRFPEGPHIAAHPTVENGQRRQLRILYLPIYEPGYPQQRKQKRGLRQALKRVGLVYEIDYLNEEVNLAHVVKAWQPDILLSQFQDGHTVSADNLKFWRVLAPRMVVVNWSGDARGLLDPDYLALLHAVDLQLVVNAAPLDTYKQLGIRAAFWQIGYENPIAQTEMPAHDVVFLGNCYSDQRRALGDALRRTSWNVGLYGAGWEGAAGDTLYDFGAGESLYWQAKIAIGDTFPDTVGFVSNRFFQALAAGAFLLQQHIPDFERYTGLVAGEHYIEWQTIEELPALIDHWMGKARAKQRTRIREAGRQYVREHYSFDAQVRKLFADLLPLIKEPVNHAEPVTA